MCKGNSYRASIHTAPRSYWPTMHAYLQPPGMVINDAGDVDSGLLREVTLVITDVEGSTELWEW